MQAGGTQLIEVDLPAETTGSFIGASASARTHRGAQTLPALGRLLAREGRGMNQRRLYRLHDEEKLRVRRRGGRKRALGTRAPTILPLTIN
jgi:hypothetical protein